MAPAGFHNGIDLPAPPGALVRAAAAGWLPRIARPGGQATSPSVNTETGPIVRRRDDQPAPSSWRNGDRVASASISRNMAGRSSSSAAPTACRSPPCAIQCTE